MAKCITANELERLPDAWVQRIYRALFATNGADHAAGKSAGSPAQPALENDSSIDHVTAIVRNSLADVLQLSEIDNERSFLDYGLDSIAGMKLAVRLEKRLKREIPPQWLFSFPTVAALSQQLSPVTANPG
jgi:acyl carrier protein